MEFIINIKELCTLFQQNCQATWSKLQQVDQPSRKMPKYIDLNDLLATSTSQDICKIRETFMRASFNTTIFTACLNVFNENYCDAIKTIGAYS